MYLYFPDTPCTIRSLPSALELNVIWDSQVTESLELLRKKKSWEVYLVDHLSKIFYVFPNLLFMELTKLSNLLAQFTILKKTVFHELRWNSLNILYVTPHWSYTLLDVFANSREATIIFDISVRPSVCMSVRMEQLGSHWTDFHEIWHWSICRNVCREN